MSETVTIPKADYDELLEAFTDVTNQACWHKDEKHGVHLFTFALSSNECALELLERLGLVEEIAYGRYRWIPEPDHSGGVTEMIEKETP